MKRYQTMTLQSTVKSKLMAKFLLSHCFIESEVNDVYSDGVNIVINEHTFSLDSKMVRIETEGQVMRTVKNQCAHNLIGSINQLARA